MMVTPRLIRECRQQRAETQIMAVAGMATTDQSFIVSVLVDIAKTWISSHSFVCMKGRVVEQERQSAPPPRVSLKRSVVGRKRCPCRRQACYRQKD